jgi:hypothetical protein
MAFFDELEGNIRTAYAKLLQKKNVTGKVGKTLNCDSFGKIMKDIKSEMEDTSRCGYDVLETANRIIFRLLQSKYFVYENHKMSALIGYLYLRKMGVTLKHYTVNGITGSSTIDDIRALTVTW